MDEASAARLRAQVAFIIEADKIKQIIRKTKLFDGSRYENDAEHSWTIALMAAVLAEHARAPVDLGRVVSMLLIHDLVEIDAGDTFLYAAERDGAHAKEVLAAERVFGLLPPDQATRFKALWEEFEARETADARFAGALDRLEPIMQNWQTGGTSWVEHGIKKEQVLAKNAYIEGGSATLWEFVQGIIDEAFAILEERAPS
jgi:putative hydrolase of HD superfamily